MLAQPPSPSEIEQSVRWVTWFNPLSQSVYLFCPLQSHPTNGFARFPGGEGGGGGAVQTVQPGRLLYHFVYHRAESIPGNMGFRIDSL